MGVRVILIRHGKTRGNLEGRYVGRTDEPLCPEGVAALEGFHAPPADALLVSPLRRCLETAAILYPGLTPAPVEGLRECDFGAFEMKNYAELNGDPAYQAWIDSGGELPFPGGESRASFQARCCRAFAEAVAGLPEDARVAVVAHGGTIMAVLSRFGEPRKGYFDWQAKNGEGFAGELARDGDGIVIREIEAVGR